MSEKILEINHIRKSFGDLRVLNDGWRRWTAAI